jgi:hypothetical protein
MARKGVRVGGVVHADGSKKAVSIDSLRLPDFSEPHCQLITICGHIEGVQLTEQIKRLDEDAQFGDGFWLHLVSEKSTRDADKKDELHLHIDLKRQFKKRKKKPSSTLNSLTAEVAKFSGKTVACWIRAEYLVPVSKLPSGGVIQAFLGLSTQAGKLNLAFRGASMSIEDEQLDELRWRLIDDGKTVIVSLDGYWETTISSTYLDDSAELLNDAFQRIVLDANKSE